MTCSRSMKLSSLGRNAQRLGAGVDVLLAGRDGDIADLAVGVADSYRNVGIIGAEQQIAHRDVGGVAGMPGERLFADRHHLGQRQPVDRDDVIAGTMPACVRIAGRR